MNDDCRDMTRDEFFRFEQRFRDQLPEAIREANRAMPPLPAPMKVDAAFFDLDEKFDAPNAADSRARHELREKSRKKPAEEAARAKDRR